MAALDEAREALNNEMQQIVKDAYDQGAVDALLTFGVEAGLIFGEAPAISKYVLNMAKSISEPAVAAWLKRSAELRVSLKGSGS